MDFDIGNILYVVITVVAIAASLLRKKKKPAGKQSKPGFFENLETMLKMGQEDPMVTDLNNHEPDLVGEYEDSEDEVIPETQGLEAEGGSLMEEYERLLAERGGAVVEVLNYEGQRSTEAMEIEGLPDDEGTDYFEILKDFDAQTAVVYSAIINRVEY